MKLKRIALLLAMMATTVAHAQEEKGYQSATTADTLAPVAQPTTGEYGRRTVYVPVEGDFRQEPFRQDTLHLPHLNRWGQPTAIGIHPLWWGGWHNWQLHEGLNVSLDASVFAQMGKHAWHKGAGFQQDVSMMYATSLTDRLSLAVGGFFSNTSWSRDSYRNAGINAVLGYKFDDHWEGYLYGQKMLTDKPMPLPLYDMAELGDRIGAAIRYNFNPTFSIQVSVEARQMPDRMHPFGSPGHDDHHSLTHRSMP